jgi:hypothetical protein
MQGLFRLELWKDKRLGYILSQSLRKRKVYIKEKSKNCKYTQNKYIASMSDIPKLSDIAAHYKEGNILWLIQ